MSLALSEHLPLIAAAPDGIQKLRELILELAVRGKLVPQEPSDELATKLLERIEQEKKVLAKKGAYKKTKPIPSADIGSQLFDLPKGWMWTNLSNVTSYIQRGKGPSYADRSNYVVVSQKCVRWYGLDLSQARCITPESFSKYDPIRLLRFGDVLWNSTGTGTIGRAAIVPNLSEEQILVADSHVTVVRPIIISSDYLWRWIQTPTVQNEIESTASGSTNQIELATSTVTAHAIPLPPLAEQHRIVAKVDELMLLCDRLESEQNDSAAVHAQLVETLLGPLTKSANTADFEANWKRIAEHFENLFTTEASIDALQNTILQLAVMGKLVQQDPSEEPAQKLLSQIAKKRAYLETNGLCKKSKAMQPIANEEEPFSAPCGWEWVRLGQIAEANTGHAFKSSEYKPAGTFVLRVTNIKPDGSLDLSDAKFIDPTDAQSKYAGVNLKKDDILLVMVGGSLGKIGIVDSKCLPAVLNQNMWKLNQFVEAPRDYFVFGLRYINNTQIKITNSTHGHLAQGDYLSKLFPLPPLAEQHRIVAKVNELMAVCDQLKASIKSATAAQSALSSALIQKALEAA